MQQTSVLIIGAGLTGLSTAYLLKKAGIQSHIIEARPRLGGRIHTLYSDATAPVEMGATWLGKKHHHLNTLLKELNIDIYEQVLGNTAIYEPISTSPPQLVNLPYNEEPSYRISGGSFALINALKAALSIEQISLGEQVESIDLQDDIYLVKTNQGNYQAPHVVSTLPPKLLLDSIAITPPLPDSLHYIGQQTHTWMGESIKVALTYSQAFWRTPSSSGTIFSSVGPIPEMYDHANVENTSFALMGFMNGTYFTLTKEERLKLIMKQLTKYYGQQAADFISYEETVWAKESLTYSPYRQHVLPHQNNGNPIFRQGYLNGKFYVAGSETGVGSPGYMDGAVESAKWVSQQIKIIKKSN